VLFKNKTGSRWQANASARTRTSQLHGDRHLLPSSTVSTRAVPIANRPHKHVPPSQPSPQMSALIPYCPCKHLSSPLPRYYRCPNYRDHITPVLRQLHWLLVRQRVVFKIAGLVHQSLGGLAPAYLADDCRLLSDVAVAHCSPTPMTCGSCSCREHITNSVIGVSRPPVLDSGTTFHLDYDGPGLTFDSFRKSLKIHLFGDRSA